ncbi:MAG TPA: M13 family metallopeptidase [Terriglobales bacterium]|nr:M13 family metallopeptidase [Terriglobales bacterium]
MRVLRLIGLLLAAAMAWAQAEGPKPMKSLDLDAMDTSADPCEDFFQYACGKWNANNPIPPDQTRWGRFDELRERNRYVLRDILEKYRAKNAGRTAVEQKIGDYYDACMDQAALEKKGLKPLQPYLKKIDKMKSKADLTRVLITLHDAGSNALFGFGAVPQLKNSTTTGAWADQGGLGLPNKDFYFKDDAKSDEIRTKYVEHVGNMLALLGESPASAKTTAAAIMKLETTLARNAQDPVTRRNPNNLDHWMKRSEFESLAPSIQWTLYYEGIGAPSFTELNVANPEFFKGLEAAVNQTDLPTIKAYLKWRLVTLAAQFLPERFQQENFNFFQKTLQGAKEIQPRWKRCANAVDADLGQALGQKYVELTFGAEGKERTLKMVHALEKALERDIEQLDWMGPETKKRAKEKLAAIFNMIGYPDQWRDYSALAIKRGDALGNSLRSNAFENRRQLRKIGNPVDRKEWPFTPPTVNAGYSPLQNRISFPAGILQPPFYSNDIDDAVNFGAIGMVIGHELTHGFDDSGRRYDAQGNLRDWWTPEDAKEFERRAACIADQYSAYSPIEGVKLNGKLTLGENVADNGGSRIALMALLDTFGGKEPEKIDGFTAEQRFFLGYGQIWCQNVTPERERTSALTDPHSPGRFRVNGVVSNSPEFQKAFGCKKGQAMVRENACRVW